MSKTVYLLTNDGNLVSFGSGMTVYAGLCSVYVANTSGGAWETILSEHDVATVGAALRSWVLLLSKCADGALLRWDEGLGQVVEGLGDDVFEETPLLTVPEVEAAPVHASPTVRLRGGL